MTDIEHNLKNQFWVAMADAPYVFLQLDSRSATAVPMRAQLDKNADSAIWFFTQTRSDFARLGAATATFTGKDHGMYARFHGTLVKEVSRERFDHFWNNFVEAWYDGGKDDPDILFLRMDLGEAELWDGDMKFKTVAKMAFGMTVHDDVQDKHTDTTL
ncbi:MAG: pyridoxamine 5'-phosphate oxidase family protein [Parerythrobacter sp.]